MKTGRIYRIIHLHSDVQYVGSTMNQLKWRWQQHKSDYKRYLNGDFGKLSIFTYFEKYGIDNFKIIIIKEYKVFDKKHLRAYEQLWINKLNCVNKISRNLRKEGVSAPEGLRSSSKAGRRRA